MEYRNHRSAASIYQTVTDRIISSLKAGVIPWEKPWKTPRYAGGPFPRNFCTGKPYRGEDERVPFVLCHYTVFNVEQCDGLTLPEIEQPTTAPEIDEDEPCESIVTGWENHPALCLNSPNEYRAYYRPLYRFRPHARAEPLCGCATLLQHLIP